MHEYHDIQHASHNGRLLEYPVSCLCLLYVCYVLLAAHHVMYVLLDMLYVLIVVCSAQYAQYFILFTPYYMLLIFALCCWLLMCCSC